MFLNSYVLFCVLFPATRCACFRQCHDIQPRGNHILQRGAQTQRTVIALRILRFCPWTSFLESITPFLCHFIVFLIAFSCFGLFSILVFRSIKAIERENHALIREFERVVKPPVYELCWIGNIFRWFLFIFFLLLFFFACSVAPVC